MTDLLHWITLLWDSILTLAWGTELGCYYTVLFPIYSQRRIVKTSSKLNNGDFLWHILCWVFPVRSDKNLKIAQILELLLISEYHISLTYSEAVSTISRHTVLACGEPRHSEFALWGYLHKSRVRDVESVSHGEPSLWQEAVTHFQTALLSLSQLKQEQRN